MFTFDDRESLRAALIERARADRRVTGVAITGSAARGELDGWSDIDLALGVEADHVAAVVDDWTRHLVDDHGAVDHLDVMFRATRYRVFLLPSTLQVDVAFAPGADLGRLGPGYALVDGRDHPQPTPAGPTARHLVGTAWLHLLHARAGLARGRRWRALGSIDGARDAGLALAALRHGLETAHGRALHRLPAEVTAPFEAALVGELSTPALRRSLGAVVEGLLGEVRHVDPTLAERLEPVLGALVRSVP